VADARAVGWREVLIVAAVAVGVVLGADVVTSNLPDPLYSVFFRTPFVIAFLVIGTGALLWRIATRRTPEA
jgi:heme A synthase